MWVWILAVILAGVAGYFFHGTYFGGKKSERFVTSAKNVKVSKEDTTVDPRDQEEILDTAADQLAAAAQRAAAAMKAAAAAQKTHKLAKSSPDTTSK